MGRKQISEALKADAVQMMVYYACLVPVRWNVQPSCRQSRATFANLRQSA